MRDTIKQVAETVMTHPKSAFVVTTMFTSHAWLNYGEPLIKALTSILGLFVIIAILVKHVIDIKKSINKSD